MNSIFDQNECVFSNQALLKIDELKMALNCSCIFNLKYVYFLLHLYVHADYLTKYINLHVQMS